MDDIAEITDWSRRSSAELWDVIEYHAEILRGMTVTSYDLAWIVDPAKALVARAEGMAAEVERLKAQVAEAEENESRWQDAYIDIAADNGAKIKTMIADNAALRAQLTEQQESRANVNHGLAVEVARSYEEQLAALRAQLAVGGWRQVSEAPTETDTLVLMRSYTNRHGYEYKRAIWQNLYENVWKNTVSRRLEGYWFSVEEDEGELDIDEWNEWLPLPRRLAPPQAER